MPFQKGNNLGGRKGYGFEKKQMKMMAQVLNEYLPIIIRILKTGGDNADYAKLTTVGADARKIMDKLHATKQENKTELSGDWQPIQIVFKKENESTPPETTEGI